MMHIGILGAGSIGCYVGGRLATKVKVTLVGRRSLVDEVAKAGLNITDCDGYSAKSPDERLTVTTDVAALSKCDVVLICVKSDDTEQAARELSPHLAPNAYVVSFQNGVRNADAIKGVIKKNEVLGAMVPFNVLRKPNATFHRGTSGSIKIERSAKNRDEQLRAALAVSGIPAESTTNIRGVLWGKLLFNLNNPLNALAGIPLRAQLGQLAYRQVLADVMEEAYRTMRAAGIKPVPMIKVPPIVSIHVLRLPDFLFFKLASTMLKIDPEARSSMWEDLERRRKTEVDHLAGEVVRLAVSQGRSAPLNQHLVDLIRRAEAAGQGSPRLTPELCAPAPRRP